MGNHITHVEVHNHSLTPAEAEVWITVHTEERSNTTEIRGRLMGPSCPYSSTIEVAYSLRPLLRPPPVAAPFTMRVVIPEASWWEPESPFLYHGPVELWQDGQKCDRVTVSHGLCSSSFSPQGLRWNGKLLQLRGRAVRALTDDDAMILRRSGVNLLLAPVHETETWNLADRFGFVVLGELFQPDEAAILQAEQLSTHPSCLGWLLHAAAPAECAARRLGRLGVAVAQPDAIPGWAAFAVCDSDRAARLADRMIPLLIQGEPKAIAPPVIGFFV